MEILLSAFYGFLIGLALSIVVVILIYRKKVISGVFGVMAVVGLAGGGAFIGFIIGLFNYDFESSGGNFWDAFYPSSILKGNIFTILFYLFVLYVIFVKLIAWNIKYMRFLSSRRQKKWNEVDKDLWTNFSEQLSAMDEKKKADKPQNAKAFRKMIRANFQPGLFYEKMHEHPEMIAPYIKDLTKYPLKEANLYLNYVLDNENTEALQEAAKLGHFEAIKALRKLDKPA